MCSAGFTDDVCIDARCCLAQKTCMVFWLKRVLRVLDESAGSGFSDLLKAMQGDDSLMLVRIYHLVVVVWGFSKHHDA